MAVLFASILGTNGAFCAAPAVDAYDREGADKLAVLKSWTAEAQKLRAQAVDGTAPTVGAEWLPVKKRLAELCDGDAATIPAVLNLFSALGEASPECLAFCHAVLLSDRKECVANRYPTALLLKKLRANDEASAHALIAALTNDPEPNATFTILVDLYPESPFVRKAIVDWAQTAAGPLRMLALEKLRAIPVAAEDATKCFDTALRLLEDPKDPENISRARLLLAGLKNKPEQVLGCLEPAQTQRALALIKPSDVQVSFLTAAFLMAGSKQIPDELADRLMEAFSGQTASKAMPLGALGLLMTQASPARAAKILAIPATRSGEANVGLFSMYLRAGGDLGFVAQQRANPERRHWLPMGGEYWQALTNCAVPFMPPLAEWKDVWIAGKDRRLPFACAVSAYPSAPEAVWVVEQALTDEQLSQNPAFLAALWSARFEGQAFAQANGLKQWLTTRAATSEVAQQAASALMASGLLFHWFGDRETALATVERIIKQIPEAARVWNPLIEILIEMDPANPILDRFRESLVAKAPMLAVAPWDVWLLDLRRGKSVNEPPRPSLARALMYSQTPSLDALAAAREKVYPWLSALRHPSLFVLGAGQSFGSMERYIGVLDRLELQRQGTLEKLMSGK